MNSHGERCFLETQRTVERQYQFASEKENFAMLCLPITHHRTFDLEVNDLYHYDDEMRH